MNSKIASLRDFPDVNVLIALMDSSHIHHELARQWFLDAAANHGYCTSPSTENGFIRVASNPSYPGNRTDTPAQALSTLHKLIAKYQRHEFLGEQLSLRDNSLVDSSSLLGHRQITDIYLLALACSANVRLVTFDQHIHTKAVRIFNSTNLLVLCS